MHIEDFNFEESDVRRTNDELSPEQKAIVDNGIRNEQIQNFTSTSSENLKT
ncbi:518_t:CDS:1, partial [Paraglomus brasilianum]